jgi:hypothetical protein
MTADLYEEKARGISQLFLAIPINLDFIQGELTMEEHREKKTAGDCQVDAEIKEGLLKHLDEHGPVSLLTSAKFGQYAGCFLEEIESAIVAESVVLASADDDPSETQDETGPAPDKATESPAAMRPRLQARRIATSYRHRRI